MSNLPGNQYAEDHEEMYHNIGQTVVAEEGQTDATLIWSAIENHATATLALAYEQRTANLIALWASPGNLPDGSYDKGMEMSGVNYGHLANQIKTRLGLGENNA